MSINRRHVLQGGAALTLAGTSPFTVAGPSDAATVSGWPSAEIIRLWPDAAPGHAGFHTPTLPADWPVVFLRGVEIPTLHVYRPERPDGRALLVCPGGSYVFVSIANEGVDVAKAFTPYGFTVFVLVYRLPGEGWQARSDVPLQDAQRALRLIRDRAQALQINPTQIGVMGFSAGGHLAASLLTGWQETVYSPIDAADDISARPDYAALLYPVVTLSDPYTHHDSRRCLLGDTPSPALIAQRSPEQHVTSTNPPCFIAHAADDETVPVDNAVLLYTALRQAQVPAELHLFERGNHAFGIGIPGLPCGAWTTMLEQWTQRHTKNV